MVSFQCDACTDVVKKPKLDNHYSKCHSSFTCVDCSTTFHGQKEYKGHQSCISEAEKYQKGLYKGKKMSNGENPSTWNSSKPSNGEYADHQHIPSPSPYQDRTSAFGRGDRSFGAGSRGSYQRGGRGRGGGHMHSRPMGTGANDTPLGTPTRMASPPSPVAHGTTKETPTASSTKEAKVPSTEVAASKTTFVAEEKNEKKRTVGTDSAGVVGTDRKEASADSSVEKKEKKRKRKSEAVEGDDQSVETADDKIDKKEKKKKRKSEAVGGDDQLVSGETADGKKGKKKKKRKSELLEGDVDNPSGEAQDASGSTPASNDAGRPSPSKKARKDKKHHENEAEIPSSQLAASSIVPSEAIGSSELVNGEKKKKKRKEKGALETEPVVQAAVPEIVNGVDVDDQKSRKKKSKSKDLAPESNGTDVPSADIAGEDVTEKSKKKSKSKPEATIVADGHGTLSEVNGADPSVAKKQKSKKDGKEKKRKETEDGEPKSKKRKHSILAPESPANGVSDVKAPQEGASLDDIAPSVDAVATKKSKKEKHKKPKVSVDES